MKQLWIRFPFHCGNPVQQEVFQRISFKYPKKLEWHAIYDERGDRNSINVFVESRSTSEWYRNPVPDRVRGVDDDIDSFDFRHLLLNIVYLITLNFLRNFYKRRSYEVRHPGCPRYAHEGQKEKERCSEFMSTIRCR